MKLLIPSKAFLLKSLLPLLLVFAVATQVVAAAEHVHLDVEAEAACLICGSAATDANLNPHPQTGIEWHAASQSFEITFSAVSRTLLTPRSRGPPQHS